MVADGRGNPGDAHRYPPPQRPRRNRNQSASGTLLRRRRGDHSQQAQNRGQACAAPDPGTAARGHRHGRRSRPGRHPRPRRHLPHLAPRPGHPLAGLHQRLLPRPGLHGRPGVRLHGDRDGVQPPGFCRRTAYTNGWPIITPPFPRPARNASKNSSSKRSGRPATCACSPLSRRSAFGAASSA